MVPFTTIVTGNHSLSTFRQTAGIVNLKRENMTRDNEARVIDTVFIAIRLAYQLTYLLQHSERLLSALLKNLDLFHRACLSEFESLLDKYYVEGNGGLAEGKSYFILVVLSIDYN